MAKYLLTYDVATGDKEGETRIRKVARICEGYGFRVQRSVFELILEKKDLTVLMHKLELLIETNCDSVRVYHIGSGAVYIIGIGVDETSATRYSW